MNLTSKRNLSTTLIILLFLTQLFPNLYLFAEDSDPAFKTVNFRLNLLTNTNRNLLHQYWEPTFGGEEEVNMPFYAGKIKAGLQLDQFNGKIENYPDYLVTFFYLGWGVDISLFSHLSWINGVRLGSYQMRFDDTDINPTQRVESELAVGIDTGLNFNLSARWMGHIGLGYVAVYTYKKIELLNLSIGISFIIECPSWLREILK